MIREIILLIIRFYQRVISPDHGIFRQTNGGCRFYPTCSEYTYQAIEKYGVGKGAWLGAKRIFKCHPWSEGGVDFVK